jgi:hypothetical protein
MYLMEKSGFSWRSGKGWTNTVGSKGTWIVILIPIRDHSSSRRLRSKHLGGTWILYLIDSKDFKV